MVSRVTPLLLGGADGDRGLLKMDSNASPQRLMFFPNFKCPKRVKDDDPVVEDQDEENEEENASDEQVSRGSSSDEESSSDDNDESKEDGKVAAATAEGGHQLSAYELQRLECIRCNKEEYLSS